MIRLVVALLLGWSALARAQDAAPPMVDAGIALDAATDAAIGAPRDAALDAPRDAATDAPTDAGLRDAGVVDAGVAPVRDAGVVAAPAGKPKTVAHEAEHKTISDTLIAIKVIGGLIALMVLAYLGGNRRVVRFQEQLGISGVITAGFPFVFLGLIASLPSIDILSGEVLDRLRPVLHFGLGWLGFIIGAQLDIRVLDRVPKGTAYMILVEALGPFGIVAAGCGALMVAFGEHLDSPDLWRNMILLGTAAAMTAPRKFRGFANRTWHEGRGVDVLLGQLDELVGVIGLLFITAYFRDASGTAWQLPNTAWIFVSLGLGVAIGVLIFAMVRVPVSNVEFLAVVLGAIAFASGLAGYLRLSPISICFIAGVLVTNFPNEQRDSIFKILNHLERPVHLLFLMIAGALWNIGDWRGWALIPLFVAGRALGKWAGVMVGKTVVGAALPAGFADQRQLVTPMSGLSIALVVSVESLYHDSGLAWIITAVIGGSIATEFLVSATSKAEDAAQAPVDELSTGGPIDELDDLDSGGIEGDGPVYRDEEPKP